MRLDGRTFDAVFARLYPALCLFVEGYVGDTHTARDIAQDAFVALWERRTGFDSETAVKAYLYSVCRNSAVDHLRRRKTRRKYAPEVPDEEPLDMKIISAELAARLEGMISHLPQESGRVFRMTIEGKSYKEIAEELRISVNTVKNQRIRALKILRARSGDLDE